MRDFLLNAHGGWRYLVVAFTIFVALYFLYALFTRRTSAKQERIVLSIWTGILDFQLLLGVILLIYYMVEDLYYSGLAEHWLAGLVAVMIGHVPALFRRRVGGEPTSQGQRLMGVVLPILVLVAIAAALRLFGIGLLEAR